jgi:hypothetical protein
MAIVAAIERVTLSMSGTTASASATLSSAITDTSQCALFVSTAGTESTNGSELIDERACRAYLTGTGTQQDPYTVNVARLQGTVNSYQLSVIVEVVQYDTGVTVQSFTRVATTATDDITITSVNLGRTFLTWSYSVGQANYDQWFGYIMPAWFLNSSTVRLKRPFAVGSITGTCYMVEGSNGEFTVQSGATTMATTATSVNDSITSVGSTANAFELYNTEMAYFGGGDPSWLTTSGELTSSTRLDWTRAKTGAGLVLHWFVVRIDTQSGAGAQVEHVNATFAAEGTGQFNRDSTVTLAGASGGGAYSSSRTIAISSHMAGWTKCDIGSATTNAGQRMTAVFVSLKLNTQGTGATFEQARNVSGYWPIVRSPRGNIVDWGTLASSGTNTSLSLSDTVSLTDASTSQAALAPAADTVSVADASTSQAALAPAADTVSVADASTSQAALAPADTVSVADASASQAALAPADTVSVADASASQAALAPAADTASITDQQASAVSLSLQDSIALSDTQLSVVARILTPNFDRVVMTDGASSSIALSQSDSATVSDSQASSVSLQENDSASVTDSSTISQSGSPQLTLSDAVSASDSPSSSVQMAAQDSITIAEDEAVAANWYRITQDRVDLTESQSSSIVKSEQDSVGAADARAVTISLIVSDSVSVLDQAIQNPFRLQESIGVSDSVSIVTQISGIDSVTIRGRTSTVGLSGRSGSISLRGLSGTTQIKGRSLR